MKVFFVPTHQISTSIFDGNGHVFESCIFEEQSLEVLSREVLLHKELFLFLFMRKNIVVAMYIKISTEPAVMNG